MRTLVVLVTAAGIVLVVVAGAAAATRAKPLCVGSGPNCFVTIQAAVDAAQDGDTIQIQSGTYKGGVTIDKSVSLKGGGADSTIVSGGGPVLTIGVFHAASEPIVSLDGITVTGGLTTSSFGTAGSRAVGGGIQIPPNADCSGGARVTIANSVITGNTAAPVAGGTDVRPCPTSFLEFSLAAGGGIYNAGDLTLVNTTVSDNTAGGPVASNAWGAGILSIPQGSSLAIKNSVVSGNDATVADPNGVQATGAGILAQTGAFAITNSAVTANTASLTSTKGAVDGVFQANGGGINCDRSATIVNTRIDANLVAVDDPNGEPAAYDSGLGCGSSGGALVLQNSIVSDNRVLAYVADTTNSGPDGVALEFDNDATVTNTRVIANSATVTAVNGLAGAQGAIFDFSADPTSSVVIENSQISDNTMTATSVTGAATAQGGGVTNNAALVLRNDRISDNTGTAQGASGFAQGGGIWNGVLFDAAPELLTLDHTTVEHNRLHANPGVPIEGGGLYTVGFPLTLSHSNIDHNVPDDCAGC